jgi:formate/nitrite transporter FocA (FNT family)
MHRFCIAGATSGGQIGSATSASCARRETLLDSSPHHQPEEGTMMPHDHSHHHHSAAPAEESGLNRLAFSATVHCLTGCAIGEVLGMVIGTALGWGNASTIGLSVTLAFVFGYGLTIVPMLRSGLAIGSALSLAFASDTASVAIMELVDNLIMLFIPGAMDAGVATLLFWVSLTFSLLVAGALAFPINRWLIVRGRGHAVVHAFHRH